MTRALSILFVAEDVPGSRSPQRLDALRRLGHRVEFVPSTPPERTCEERPGLMRRLRHRLRRPADESGMNAALRRLAAREAWDVLLADNAMTLENDTLRAVKAACPSIALVWYSEDDLMNPRLGSVQLDRSLGRYDLWVTTKSFNADPAEMPARGVRRVMVVPNSFDPVIHHPIELSAEERRTWAADAAFAGTYEAPRAASLLALARAGITVRVWGNGWDSLAGAHPLLRIEGRPAYGDDLRRVIAGAAVNLAFLRKANRDLQTCRTMEIPACGGFMMHERTPEVAALLADGEEVVLFDDDDDLIERMRRWLSDPEGRTRIAQAGRRRMLADGHDHDSRLAAVLAAAVDTDRG